MTRIALDDLNISFATKGGVHRAIRNLSLQLGTGRILGLVGESGSGKSTVALALMGLLAENAQITKGGLALGKDSFDLAQPGVTAHLRGSRIAMIFQDPFTTLNPAFTVAAHLHEVLLQRRRGRTKAARKAAALDALQAVGLPNPAQILKRYPFELSGGMRQRVSIAMALLAAPELLIADEPTTALDASVEAQVLQQLCALRERIGCSMIIVTHALGLVAKYCDDIAVMYAGEMVETGTVADVIDTPRHPYTKALLACELTLTSPRKDRALDNRFQMVAGELPSPFNPPQGCVFQSRCAAAMPRCAQSLPPAYAVAPDSRHQVRCFLEAK